MITGKVYIIIIKNKQERFYRSKIKYAYKESKQKKKIRDEQTKKKTKHIHIIHRHTITFCTMWSSR